MAGKSTQSIKYGLMFLTLLTFSPLTLLTSHKSGGVWAQSVPWFPGKFSCGIPARIRNRRFCGWCGRGCAWETPHRHFHCCQWPAIWTWEPSTIHRAEKQQTQQCLQVVSTRRSLLAFKIALQLWSLRLRSSISQDPGARWYSAQLGSAHTTRGCAFRGGALPPSTHCEGRVFERFAGIMTPCFPLPFLSCSQSSPLCLGFVFADNFAAGKTSPEFACAFSLFFFLLEKVTAELKTWPPTIQNAACWSCYHTHTTRHVKWQDVTIKLIVMLHATRNYTASVVRTWTRHDCLQSRLSGLNCQSRSQAPLTCHDGTCTCVLTTTPSSHYAALWPQVLRATFLVPRCGAPF